MTERSGGFIQEEINKVRGDLNKLIKAEKVEYKALVEEAKKVEEEIKKGKRTSGKSILEEELEWDWNNTCLEIEDKRRKLIELSEEGIVDKLIERAELDLKWAEEFLKDSAAKEKVEQDRLKNLREGSGNKSDENVAIEDLQRHRSTKTYWTKEKSVLKNKLRRLKSDKEKVERNNTEP